MHVRLWPVLAIAALVVGCGSENDLLSPAKGDRPPPTTPAEEEVPPPADRAALDGIVCAPDGESTVAHAKVTVQHAEGQSQATTDGAGAFRIDDLPPGPAQVDIVKGSFDTTLFVELVPGELASLTVDDDCTPVEQGDTRIAVVTGEYDQIEQILDQLDLEYDTVRGVGGSAYVDFLRDPAAMAAYDVVFFNCGMGLDWLDYKAEVGANLRDYVQSGGSIYASDWAYWLVETGWPSQHDWYGPDTNAVDALVGDTQTITANVQDAAMAAALGSDTASLRYDLSGWAAMEGASGEVLIEGTYRYWDFFSQGQISAPLATRLHDGEGSVLYTSFHNEGQNTADMVKLLQEIILSL